MTTSYFSFCSCLHLQCYSLHVSGHDVTWQQKQWEQHREVWSTATTTDHDLLKRKKKRQKKTQALEVGQEALIPIMIFWRCSVRGLSCLSVQTWHSLYYLKAPLDCYQLFLNPELFYETKGWLQTAQRNSRFLSGEHFISQAVMRSFVLTLTPSIT